MAKSPTARTKVTVKTSARMSKKGPLSPDALRKLDAWWRASNYLAAGQLYLRDNPLLRVPLLPEHFRLQAAYVKRTAQIGLASFFNQIAMMIVQVVLNNSLTYYGARSIYGEAIPLACAGIVIKVNQVFFSIVIGLAQGSQPVESFNYGAEKYDRVRQAYRLAATAGVIISVISFALFQIFPRQILSLFGTGTAEYFDFGVRFFRIYLFFIWLDALQPITSTFFTSIGKPAKGIFLSLTRQIIFFVPLLLILPLFMGVDGCIYTGPIADFVAAMVTIVMAFLEFRKMPKTAVSHAHTA